MPTDFLTIPQSLTRFRLANARVPVCLIPDPAQLKPDTDGLASCDIVIEKEHIAAIDAPSAPPTACRASISTTASCCRAWSMCTRISTRVTSGARAEPGRHVHGRAHDRDGGPRGELVGRGRSPSRMDFALRCAFAHGTGALRTHINFDQASRPHLLGACSPRCASSGRAASRCRPPRSIRSNGRSTMRRSSARWWRR